MQWSCGLIVLRLTMTETLAPELDLIDSRIVAPCKELVDICKRIRKTCVKRDHKLVDYDRHNNSLNKLREKKEKSLSDEKNLFKASALWSDPHPQLTFSRSSRTLSLLQRSTSITTTCSRPSSPSSSRWAPDSSTRSSTRSTTCSESARDPKKLAIDSYRLNVYYIMLEKLQSYADGKYDLSRKDIENIYLEQRGDAAERLDELTITKRMVSTAKMLQTHRSASGSTVGRSGSFASGKSGLDRKTSNSAYGKKAEEAAVYSPPSRIVAAPPPYTSTSSSGSVAKKAPPPPPPLKPKPSYNAVKYATAIFDFEAQVCVFPPSC